MSDIDNQFLPYIIYINLEKRQDRKEQLEKELLDYGLSQFERFDAIPHSSGIVGCGKSHLEVLKMAKQRQYKSILILEDDFTFLVSREELEKEMVQLSEIDYDVCMLAYHLEDSCPIENSPVIKVLTAQTASAYIVKEHYYDDLIDLYEHNIPLLESTGEHWNYANDQCWKTLQKKHNWVCPKPRIGKQRDGYSDNCQCYVNYNC